MRNVQTSDPPEAQSSLRLDRGRPLFFFPAALRIEPIFQSDAERFEKGQRGSRSSPGLRGGTTHRWKSRSSRPPRATPRSVRQTRETKTRSPSARRRLPFRGYYNTRSCCTVVARERVRNVIYTPDLPDGLARIRRAARAFLQARV